MIETEVIALPSRSEPSRAARWSGERTLVGVITLVAFGLRVFRLGTQSLWGDEMFSVFRAAESLSAITEAVPRESTLPPLYYYLLHFWLPIAGRSETAVRFLSLIFGVMAIPLLYVLVRRTLDRRVAVIAAVIGTFSPFWIYYSQETRTYAQVTTLLILALYLLVRASSPDNGQPGRRIWVGYVVAAALALYSYYFAAFALGAGVFWVLVLRRDRPEMIRRCIFAQLGVVALMMPLAVYTGRSILGMIGSVQRVSTPPSIVFAHLELAFNFGTTIELQKVLPLVILAFVLAGLGLIAMPTRSALLWGLLLIVPLAAIDYISFVPQIKWERYFLTATPAWYTLIASGLSAIAFGFSTSVKPGAFGLVRQLRPYRVYLQLARLAVAIAAGGALATGMAWSLHNYYFDPSYWRFDFRSAVQKVDGVATPDVEAIVNGPPHYPSFFYYYRPTIPAIELPAPGASVAATITALTQAAERYRGIWLVKFNPPGYDPNGAIEVWLDQNAYQASYHWVENVSFGFYVTEDPTAPHVVATFPVNRTFGSDAEIVSYRASTVHAQGTDYLLVALTWRALRTPTERIQVFAHLLDRDGNRISQSDHEPVGNTRPVSTWKAGDIIVDRFALALPSDASSRGLHLTVGLYHPNGSRLPVIRQPSPNDEVTLPLPGLNPIGPMKPLPRQIGTGIALLGYTLRPDPVLPGHTLSLTLYWKRTGDVARDYTTFTHLLGPGNRIVAQKDSPPVGGQRPTTSWLPGEVIEDTYQVTIPTSTAPGTYHIEVGMYDPTNGQRLPIRGDGTTNDHVAVPDVVTVAVGR